MSPDEKPSKKRDKPTHRSRAYPAITLEAAIARTKTLYDNDKRHPILTRSAVAYWDLSEGSGSAIRTLAALRHYGLTEATGRGDDRRLRVTDLGMEIVIHPDHDSDEFIRYVQQAALTPPFFKELWEKYDGELPNDVSLKHELERSGDLNANIIPEFISTLRANLEFAKLNGSSILAAQVANKDTVKDPPKNENEGGTVQIPKRPAMPTANQTYYDVSVPLKGSAPAALHIPMPLSAENYDYMIKMLEAQMSLVKSMRVMIVEEPQTTQDDATPTS